MLKRIYKELLFIRKDIAEIRKCMEREARCGADIQVISAPHPWEGQSILDEPWKDEAIQFQIGLNKALKDLREKQMREENLR